MSDTNNFPSTTRLFVISLYIVWGNYKFAQAVPWKSLLNNLSHSPINAPLINLLKGPQFNINDHSDTTIVHLRWNTNVAAGILFIYVAILHNINSEMYCFVYVNTIFQGCLPCNVCCKFWLVVMFNSKNFNYFCSYSVCLRYLTKMEPTSLID